MTGSGTLSDPYVILNAADLQLVKDDILAYYELGVNVDATASRGWNGGAGFVQAGIDQAYYNRLPESDVSRAGVWTINPADGIIWTKLTSDDGDTTYAESGSAGANFICSVFPPIDFLTKPLSQCGLIYVRVYAESKGLHAVNYNYAKGRISIGGVVYLNATQKSLGRNSYTTRYWQWSTNPATGLAWTLADLATIDGVGIQITNAAPAVRVTYAYLSISYELEWAGHFDGKGHSISNLYINRPTEDCVGLFGFLEGPAIVQDITLLAPTIIGDSHVGVVAHAHGGCQVNNVHVIEGHMESDGAYCGSIIGEAEGWAGNRGTTRNCTATGTMSNVAGGWFQRGGGIAGSAEYWDFEECGADVDITDPAGYYFGGFVNYLHNCTAYRCYGLGDINALEDSGSFACSIHGDTYCEDCYGLGDVICTSAGWSCGGFTAGIYNTAHVKNCYHVGRVVHNNPASDGAFCGVNTSTDAQVFASCFYNTDSGTITAPVGAGSDAGITGLDTDEMQNQLSPFSDGGWDIEEIESADLADGYPFLSWQAPGASPIWYIFPLGSGGGPGPGGPVMEVVTLPATEVR